MEDYTNNAVKAIMAAYTPVEVKTLLHNHDEANFVHHQTTDEIVDFYAEHNEDIHHWLLDDSHAFEYYWKAQAAYNYAQAKWRYYFILLNFLDLHQNFSYNIIRRTENMLTLSLLTSLLLFLPQDFMNLYNYQQTQYQTELCYII